MTPELTEVIPTTLGWGTVLHILSVLILCAHLLNKPRDSRTSLLWIFFASIFPFIGVSAYVLFGINTAPNKGWEKQLSDSRFNEILNQFRQSANPLTASGKRKKNLQHQPRLENLQVLNQIIDQSDSYHPLLGGNSIDLLDDAVKAIDQMLDSIEGAKNHIHVSTYILADDETGKRLMKLLVKKASQGVTVRILYDAFGSAEASLKLFFWRFRNIPNLQIIGFSQVNILKRKFQLNNRNHRKLLILDGEIAYTGGINFHNVYMKRGNHSGTKDYHFKIKGPVVLDLQYTFLRDWFYVTNEPAEKLLDATYFPDPEIAGNCTLRVVNSGPTQDEKAVALETLFAAASIAKKQLLILTPYFVPPQSLILALRMAARRGVDVRILVPCKNNHPTLQQASHALYETLLLAGVHIFEREPPFIHAKATIIDDEAAIIGSANVDPRSLYFNYETNVMVYDKDFTSTLKRAMLEEFNHATEITHVKWNQRSHWKKLVENFFNLFHPIA
ncbi:MAG: cardiolipin synthase [Kiritimatiellae bacterium]|jgi:cardiolipin synthase|nr:cardiolipin synthase [Kiritimatiellia bacterium]